MRNIPEKIAVFVLLATSLLISYSFVAPARAVSPDFNVKTDSSFLASLIGGSTFTLVSVASQNGFNGPVVVTSTVTHDSMGRGPVLNPASTSLILADGNTGMFTLYVQTSGSTPEGIYTVTIRSVAGPTSSTPGASHAATVTVVVSPLIRGHSSIIGGDLVAVNKLLLLSPLIAIAGILGALGVFYISRKRR